VSNVVETLELTANELGYPKAMRLDNGPEYISRDIVLWASPRLACFAGWPARNSTALNVRDMRAGRDQM
jgi:hypothetical protein